MDEKKLIGDLKVLTEVLGHEPTDSNIEGYNACVNLAWLRIMFDPTKGDTDSLFAVSAAIIRYVDKVVAQARNTPGSAVHNAGELYARIQTVVLCMTTSIVKMEGFLTKNIGISTMIAGEDAIMPVFFGEDGFDYWHYILKMLMEKHPQASPELTELGKAVVMAKIRHLVHHLSLPDTIADMCIKAGARCSGVTNIFQSPK